MYCICGSIIFQRIFETVLICLWKIPLIKESVRVLLERYETFALALPSGFPQRDGGKHANAVIYTHKYIHTRYV